MNRQSWNQKLWSIVAGLTAVASLGALPTMAQVPVDASGNPLHSTALPATGDAVQGTVPLPLGSVELAELVGPVALYPDDLLAIVLPASTYPLEIVQAARFLDDYEQDSTLKPNEEWDESVTALLNYPEVLRMMNDDIDWTWKLGDAVVDQQADVIAAVETFRDRAYAAGNLKSDQYQTVREDEGIIEIVPVNDEIIYVPYYEPERVLVSQVTPVYYYYPRPYPVYYYPYPAGFSFYNGYFWGVTTAYRIGWTSHHLHVHHHSYWGHPYFGHSYYGHYYRRPSVQVYNTWYVDNSVRYSTNRYRDGDYWRPRNDSRARPAHYTSRTRSYRDQDVRRGSSYGSASTTRVSGQRESRQVQSDTIRFRERPESNRQEVRSSPATTRQSADVNRQAAPRRDGESAIARMRRALSDNDSRPATATTSDRSRQTPARPQASSRSDAAATGSQSVVRRDAAVTRPQPDARRDTATTRPSSGSSTARTPQRESRNASRNETQHVTRDAPVRQASRAEPGNNARERSEPQQEARASARESRPAQASVRERNESRRSRD
jgi:hypothetical protein